MLFKIDTREKFYVIKIEENDLSANLADDFTELLTNCLDTMPKNSIINLNKVDTISTEIIQQLVAFQEFSLENNISLVFCELTKDIKSILSNQDLLDIIHTTPTESEAIDMIYMEEMEREMWDGHEL
jgi:anti-anti-sigma regulatory factor